MLILNLPEELLFIILSYSYRIQSEMLLKDIRSYVNTKSILNNKYTNKENLLLNVIYRLQSIKLMNYKMLYDKYDNQYCLNIILSSMTLDEREYIS